MYELPYVFKFELVNRLLPLYDSAGLGSRDRDRMYNDELAGLMSRVRTDETLNRRPVVVAGLGSRVVRLATVVVAGLGSRFRIGVETSKAERRSTIGLGSRSLGLLQRLLVDEYLDDFGSVVVVVGFTFVVPYFEFVRFNFFAAVLLLLVVLVAFASFSLVVSLDDGAVVADAYLLALYVDTGVASRLVLWYVPPEYDGRYVVGDANEPNLGVDFMSVAVVTSSRDVEY